MCIRAQGDYPLFPSFASDLEVLLLQVDIGDCLARGWRLSMNNAGLLFPAAFLVWIIGTISQYIPMLGLVYLVFHGVFYGGLYLIILKRIRGEPASVGMTFEGFRIAFVQLLLAGLIGSLLSWIGIICCLIVPGLYLLVSWVFSLALVVAFMLVVSGCKYLGSGYWVEPALAAWLPLMIFVPCAFALYQPLRE